MPTFRNLPEVVFAGVIPKLTHSERDEQELLFSVSTFILSVLLSFSYLHGYFTGTGENHGE